jgi:putative ABC transport system permease protein
VKIDLAPSRLTPRDLVRVSAVGLRTRKMRAALSALGIAIGVASLVAVIGLSESSRSALLAQLEQLGTNFIQVRAAQGVGVSASELPEQSKVMVSRIGGVQSVAAVFDLEAGVYRNDLVPSTRSGGISVKAADRDLLRTLHGTLAFGRFLDTEGSREAVTVLGSVAAQRLGIRDLSARPRVWLGERWFRVIGILDPILLSPAVERAALISRAAAVAQLDQFPAPSLLYVRTDPDRIDEVLNVMAATASPERPDEIEATRPTELIEAREAANVAFTSLLLGLGGVALLVGGVGIANVMVISVLERRSEIGLRRALGATRRHVGAQFLGEALTLAAIGGGTGVVVGAAVTAAYAFFRGWGLSMPGFAIGGGILAALIIGAVAGLYPASRAARMSPTEALRTT